MYLRTHLLRFVKGLLHLYIKIVECMFGPVVVNARFLTQPITGTQRFAIELCRALKVEMPDLTLLSPDAIVHQNIADELGVQVVGRFKQGILWEQIELPRLLRRNGDPLLINLCNVAPVAYKNNLVSILDLSFHYHPEWFSRTFSLLYNTIIPRVAMNARKIITISKHSQYNIAASYHIPLETIDIIYPSVSSGFSTGGRSQLNTYGKYILAVSSLDPRKNFRGLIQAYKACSFTDIKLVIVGSAHKVFADNDLQQMTEGDASIIFTGYVSDDTLSGLYRNALLFAYPSYFEGFGIPPLEAMICGCPTVVSNTTSLPEVCGDASVYVNPYSIEDISEGLMKVVNNDELRKELIAKGLEQVRKFDWQHSAYKLTVIINNIINT